MLNRRETLRLSGACAGVAFAGLPTFAIASTDPTFEDLIRNFTGDAAIEDSKVSLTMPHIAENGFSVPLDVGTESPMKAEDYVEEITILAPLNPNIRVATFRFSPLSGEAAVTTRIRLAQTQEVFAIAKMSTGSFHRDKKFVRVTVGGCGA